MFNIGPMELMVLGIVGLVVLGPDRLPGFVRDAARLLRSLREMATGAREQLRDELGPEFAEMDLRNLNPRTYVTKAVFGDDLPDLRKFDPRRFDPKTMANDFIKGGDGAAANGSSNGKVPGKVSMTKPNNAQAAPPARPRPRPRPNGAGSAASRFDDTT